MTMAKALQILIDLASQNALDADAPDMAHEAKRQATALAMVAELRNLLYHTRVAAGDTVSCEACGKVKSFIKTHTG